LHLLGLVSDGGVHSSLVHLAALIDVAKAAGVPVVAYAVGGAGETVLDGRTGVLFGEQDASSLAAAIERLEDLVLSEAEVRENAARFGRRRFRAEMAELIEQASAQPRPR